MGGLYRDRGSAGNLFTGYRPFRPSTPRCSLVRTRGLKGGTMIALGRRNFLQLAASAAALPGLPGIAGADGYPSRPVHIVTGYPAGASPDIIARLIADALSRRLGQQFIVDNRP